MGLAVPPGQQLAEPRRSRAPRGAVPPVALERVLRCAPSSLLAYNARLTFRNAHSAEYFRQQASPAGPSFSATGPAAASAHAPPRAGFAPAFGAYGSSMGGMGGMGMMGGGGMMSGMYSAQGQQPMQQQPDVLGKGKGRFVELDDADWEAQFARAGESATKAAEPAPVVEGTQPATMNLLDGDTVIDASDADAELLASLEDTWSNLQSTLTQSSVSDAEMAAWEAQYGSQFADLNGDSGLGEIGRAHV